MSIYYITTICSALLMYYIQNKNRRMKSSDSIYTVKRYSYTYVFPFFPLFLLSALRYGIGTDYFFTYYPTFVLIKKGYEPFRTIEVGYVWLNKLVASFSDDVTWVMAVCALLFFIFLGKAIVEQSDNPMLSILLLFGTGLFNFSMNGVRQAIAIAGWFYSIKYIRTRKLISFILCMLLCSLFHFSSLFMIPFYFILQKRYKPTKIFFAIIVTWSFLPALKQFILWISKFTKYYEKFINTSQVEGNFAYSSFFVLIGILIYLLFIYHKMKNDWEYSFLLNSIAVGTILTILTKNIFIMARILAFFQYMPVLFLPRTLAAFNKENRKIVGTLFVLVYFAYIWFMAGYLGKGESVPYQSIFSR